jgi:hypothetical protein
MFLPKPFNNNLVTVAWLTLFEKLVIFTAFELEAQPLNRVRFPKPTVADVLLKR